MIDPSPPFLLVSAPSAAEFLGYSGEHTCILYAGAVLWDALGRGSVRAGDGSPLGPGAVRLLAWRSLSARVWDELEASLAAAPPRLVGVSYMTATVPTARRIAATVRRLAPEAVVVFGGPHEDEMLSLGDGSAAERFPEVDVSVAGEGNTRSTSSSSWPRAWSRSGRRATSTGSRAWPGPCASCRARGPSPTACPTGRPAASSGPTPCPRTCRGSRGRCWRATGPTWPAASTRWGSPRTSRRPPR